MRSIRFLTLLPFLLATVFFEARAQGNETSKGTEFWTAYMDHINAPGVDGSAMVLYITSDVATSGVVDFADGTASMPFTVVANQVTFVNIPAGQFLGAEGQAKKGIHITALNPVAVYAHIYFRSVSGATLLLPVNTLGKNYYSLNYTQVSNSGSNSPAYSAFIVIATEDNTTVEITPSATLLSGKAVNTPFTITLNKGELYQGLSPTDLTGTKIRSVSVGGTTCKRIAVFSGSSKIGIGCINPTKATNDNSLSSDNLFQQVYPTSAWGKNYITVSLKNRNYDVYRIILSDPATNVTLNGAVIPAASFVGNFYYEFKSPAVTTNVISADKPIQVVQYASTQNQTISCAVTNGDIGDPEMIYLNPIEQGLDHVTLYSTGYYNISQSYINVVLPTAAVSTFTLDGTPYNQFSPVTGNTAYSFAQISVTSGPRVSGGGGTISSGTHNIAASVPFNAIAYGFGPTESYGYAAGTNLQDLNDFILLNDPVTNTSSSTGCIGTTYNLQISLPYQTNSIKWDLKDGSTPIVDNNPTPVAQVVKGSQTLYVYQYATPKTYNTVGNYQVVATVFNPTTDDCGTNQDIELDFTIAPLPVAKFTPPASTCPGDVVTFTDQSDYKGANTKSWAWDFGDASNSTTANPNTAIVAKPTHIYTQPGDYTITLSIVNENGCSSTTTQQLHVNVLPKASFTTGTPLCETGVATFTDTSTPGDGTNAKWLWNFGDGSAAETHTDNLPVNHTFTKAGSYAVTLAVTSSTGCTGAPFTQQVVINPLPKVDFTLPAACLNDIVQFFDKSTIADNTQSAFTYLWDFGDPNATPTNANTSTLANPTHQFTQARDASNPYKITLTVTSKYGCTNTATQLFTVSELPEPKFGGAVQVCLGNTTHLVDQSDPKTSTLKSWFWDLGDGQTATTQNVDHIYTNTGDYPVKLTVTTVRGCQATSVVQTVHVSPLPKAAFSYSSTDCEGSAITFTDQSTTAEGKIAAWNWDFGDGSAPQSFTTNAPFTHIFTTAGTYTVSLTVTTDQTCTSAALPQQIIVHPLPQPDFTLPDACIKDSPQFMNLSTIADHTESGFTYLWNFGDPNATATNPNTSTQASPSHMYVQPNPAYHVSLTVTSKYGCSATTTHDFPVNGASPTADFKIDPANSFCSSDPVTFINLASVQFGVVTRILMYYDLANHPSDYTEYTKDQIAANIPFTHDYGQLNVPGATKDYAVQMIAYSGTNQSCAGASTIKTVTLKASPLLTLAPAAQICRESGTRQISADTHGFTGTSLFSGTGVSASGLFDPQTSGPGTFTISCVFTADNSCSVSAQTTVTVYPTPTVSAGGDLHLLQGGTLTINATAGGNNLTYKWTLADGSEAVGLSADNVLTPIANPANDTQYMLTVTSADGCTASSKVWVYVLKAPVVPNTFTPNNDGINDTWDIKYLDTYPKCSVDVYNRYGEKVYSSIGYPTPWDGTYKGADLPVGTYYYIINPKNGRTVISGSITIIR